jgi:hypothetical protein
MTYGRNDMNNVCLTEAAKGQKWTEVETNILVAILNNNKNGNSNNWSVVRNRYLEQCKTKYLETGGKSDVYDRSIEQLKEKYKTLNSRK